MSADWTKLLSPAGYDRAQLQELLKQIGDRHTPGWNPGEALEYVVLRAFQLEGAEVKPPYPVQLDGEIVEQVDGVVYAGALACLVECKDEAARVNVEPLAKLRNQLLRRPSGVIGLVVSWSGFTDPAVTLASFFSPQGILLWTGKDLQAAVKKGWMLPGLERKFRHLVEHGIPDFSLREESLG